MQIFFIGLPFFYILYYINIFITRNTCSIELFIQSDIYIDKKLSCQIISNAVYTFFVGINPTRFAVRVGIHRFIGSDKTTFYFIAISLEKCVMMKGDTETIAFGYAER